MSVNDPPQFNSSIFNNTAFIDTTETLTLGDANNLYLKKNNPSITGNLSLSGTLTTSNAGQGFIHNDGTISLISWVNNSSIANNAYFGTFTNHNLYLQTNNVGRLFISNTGNVGVGTNSPNYKLDVSGTTKTTQLLVGDSIDNSSNRLISALDNNLPVNTSKFICFGKSNSINNQGEISFYLNGDGSSSNYMAFGLYGGSIMYISALGGGRCGLGVSNPSYQLHLSSDSAAKPTSALWTISSDERIKENIQDADLDICYNNVKNLKLKYYKWKDDFIENHSVKDTHKLGWIAQDVEPLIPKAITTINNEQYNIEDFKSLNVDQIYACMYGAIQKIINKIENIENFISSIDIEEQ